LNGVTSNDRRPVAELLVGDGGLRLL